MAQKYTAEQLSHHLDYEIRMLNASYDLILRIENLLKAAGASEDDQHHALWAMMEDFCLHARQLVEFLIDKSHENSASKHSDGRYAVPGAPKFADGKTYARKLNNQVAHLMDGRTDVLEEKLQGVDRDAILRWIHVALKDFRASIDTNEITFRDANVGLIPVQTTK